MDVQDDLECSLNFVKIKIKIKKKEKKERNSINHILGRCNSIKPFWDQFQMAVSDRCANSTPVTLNESIVLFGHDSSFKSDDTFDLIIALANNFIYKCKIQKNIPQFDNLKSAYSGRWSIAHFPGCLGELSVTNLQDQSCEHTCFTCSRLLYVIYNSL